MRPWDLETNAARMRKATEALQLSWQETNDVWNDSVSQKFCETYLEPLGPAMKLTLDAVGRMQQLVNEIQRDCEE